MSGPLSMYRLEKITPRAPQALTREAIQCAEAILRKYPQTEVPIEHYFAEGLYAREMRVPAGTIITGKLHRTGHLNFLMQGEITVWAGETVKTIKAPAVIPSPAGTKKAAVTHTDVVWVTVHASHETDVEKLEAELIEPEIPLIDGDDSCHLSQLP